MAIINQSNILNLQPGITAPVVVHMSEGDSGTKLSFKLIDGANAWTDPGNVVAAVHGRRQDGTQFGPYACTISGDVVSFETDAAMAGAAGSGIAEIVLTDSDQNTAGTANFAIMVERATFPMGVTYTNDVSVYEAILTYAQSADASLQKQITAEATARQTADNTLQGNINSEASTRAAADSNLQSQINQIIAPSGEAPSAAEVQNARIGADGVTYDTLGTAIRTQVNDINDAIADLDKIFYEQYIDIENSSIDYYWKNVDTKANKEGFYAFESFVIRKGTYYYSNLASDFCFFKSISNGNITKPLLNKRVLTKIKITEPTIVYLTTSTKYDVDKAFFANFDILLEQKKGINGLSVSNVLDTNKKYLLEQYLDHNLTLANYYWKNVDSYIPAEGFYAFYPIEVKAGTYYYRDFNKDLSLFKASDGTQSKPFTTKEGFVTFDTNGTIYITANDSNYMKSIFCDAKVPKSMGQLKGKILNLIPKYSLVNDVKHDFVQKNDYFAEGAELENNVCTVSRNDGGVTTTKFKTISSKVLVEYDLLYSGTADLRIYLKINKKDGTAEYVKKYESNQNDAVTGSFTFDSASYSVYNDADSYQVLLWSDTGSIITVNDLSVREVDSVETSKYYSDNLSSFLDNLSNGINNVESIALTQSASSLKSPNGSKFGLIVNDDGTLSTYKYIPNKYTVMGNSITCGMDNKNEHGGMFGMASTSFDKDWVHYVNDAIANKNNGATYNRIYVSPFEHCENIVDANAWITTNINQLSSDNDLVIIQIGDNVNTDMKKETFKLSFPKLLNSIREKCPKARVVCVGIWFKKDDVKDVIKINCSKYGCSFIDITDLNTKENQAVVGSEVTFKDGSKGTITSEIATHPGDKGMKLIGERIVEKLEL